MIQLTITSDGGNTSINVQTPDGEPAPIRQVLDMISAAENAILGIPIPTQPLGSDNPSDPEPQPSPEPRRRRKPAKKGEAA